MRPLRWRFYEAAFGAIEISRVEASDGHLVIDLAIGQARFRVVDEAPKAFNLSPETLGGTSVRLNLLVEEPDATAAQAVAAGAVEVFPIADQPYGPDRDASQIRSGITGRSGSHSPSE